MTMHRFTILALFASVALAQSDNPFNRPPADVDQALRARIKEFFEYHVTGEYRKAEKLVAEDTQDYFYTHEKPRYMSIKIGQITYSENFTRALAIVLCEQKINMPMINGTFDVPTRSSWKLENGKWYWWVDPKLIGESPFGQMKPGPDAPKTPGAQLTMATAPTSPDFLFTQVQLDKKELALKAGQSETVTISNSAPGVMSVSIPAPLAGIEAKFDKGDMESGGKATLTVTAGKDAKSGVLEVHVTPTGQILPVQITVK
jgi:hypothetical protein